MSPTVWLLVTQDETVTWAQRALQALQSIASHPVSLDFAKAASAPVASRQLAQSWQAFRAAVSRSSAVPEIHMEAADASMPNVSAAFAASAAPPAAPAASLAAPAADGSKRVSAGAGVVAGGGQQLDTDEPEDEEVCITDSRLFCGCLRLLLQCTQPHCTIMVSFCLCQATPSMQ